MKVCADCGKSPSKPELICCEHCHGSFVERESARVLSKEEIKSIADQLLKNWRFWVPVALGIIALAWLIGGIFDYFADIKVTHFIGQETNRMESALATGFTVLNSNVAFQLEQPRVAETLSNVVNQQATQLWSIAVAPTLSNFQSSIQAKTKESSDVLEAMKDYSEVATLNLIGQPDVTGAIVFKTPVSVALEGSYQMHGITVTFFRDEHAEKIFRKVIADFPRFPFAYFALASALSARGDPSWKDYAGQCLTILEKTTKVPGHHFNHDEKLAELRKILNR